MTFNVIVLWKIHQHAHHHSIQKNELFHFLLNNCHLDYYLPRYNEEYNNLVSLDFLIIYKHLNYVLDAPAYYNEQV